MSLTALERMEEAQRAFIAALDASDIDAIESAGDVLRHALDDVRAVGAWRGDPAIRECARRVLQLVEAAGMRVNFLTDHNRQRIDALETFKGRMPVHAYAADGRVAA